jgi:hypothetical protein
MPTGQAQDFTLWRNIMREYSEELLGNPEHDGDGQPVDYHREPFSTFDSAYQDGRFRVHCLGIALDALSLFGEILTVAVVEADLFDTLARDFVDLNDEGQVLNVLAPFTKDGLDRILGSGQLAPAGAGCVTLAWQHRQHLLGPNADGARVSVR